MKGFFSKSLLIVGCSLVVVGYLFLVVGWSMLLIHYWLFDLTNFATNNEQPTMINDLFKLIAHLSVFTIF